jgi:hypothetical protein
MQPLKKLAGKLIGNFSPVGYLFCGDRLAAESFGQLDSRPQRVICVSPDNIHNFLII